MQPFLHYLKINSPPNKVVQTKNLVHYVLLRHLFFFWVNLHGTSFFNDIRSKRKEEEKQEKIYDSFKLNQKQQLHYLGQGLAFVYHETTESFSEDSYKPFFTNLGHIINFSQLSQNWGFPHKNGLETVVCILN